MVALTSLPFLGVIHEAWQQRQEAKYPLVVLAVNRGVPFVISHKDSQVSRDIFTLAAKLSSGEAEAAASVAGKQAKPASGGLKLFGAR